jgi:hypothetical protein
MSKSRAALSHLWPSLLVLATLAVLILFTWYPYPFRQFGESGKFAALLILAAVCLAPALTWFVYRQGKRGLLFDLWVIVIIQLAAIAWGTYSLYQSRPYFMVHTIDRFEVFSKRDVDVTQVTDSRFLDKPLAGPILLYANMPTDPVAFQKLLHEVMFEGKPDLQYRPEFWSLYAERQQLALEKSRPLEDLRNARPESFSAIDQLVDKSGGDIGLLRFVPALLTNGQFAVILDANSGEVVDTLMIDPWLR